ncbi:uncharacterized protein LOC120009479 [Tripterygium wilfordii]|uniref:uncharacterized protein LOC120009479 n=1 Tax=Tripterygium wilfordii TaxID=458696 RepID=UPI0018F81CD6|nr:uncharacterized protein LOC120009479 [Tripterygium wilfordii]
MASFFYKKKLFLLNMCLHSLYVKLREATNWMVGDTNWVIDKMDSGKIDKEKVMEQGKEDDESIGENNDEDDEDGGGGGYASGQSSEILRSRTASSAEEVRFLHLLSLDVKLFLLFKNENALSVGKYARDNNGDDDDGYSSWIHEMGNKLLPSTPVSSTEEGDLVVKLQNARPGGLKLVEDSILRVQEHIRVEDYNPILKDESSFLGSQQELNMQQQFKKRTEEEPRNTRPKVAKLRTSKCPATSLKIGSWEVQCSQLHSSTKKKEHTKAYTSIIFLFDVYSDKI